MVTVLIEGDLETEPAIMWSDHEEIVGMDIETSGLNKQTDRIACVQIYFPVRDIAFIVRNLKDNPKNFIHLMNNKRVRKVFHYAGFDLAFLMRDYPEMEPLSIADTKIAAKLLDPKKELFYDPNKEKHGQSLAALVHYYFGIKLDKTLAVSDWFGELSKEQLEYAVNDVCYLPTLIYQMEAELKRRRLLKEARKAFDYLPTRVRLEMKGLENVYGY